MIFEIISYSYAKYEDGAEFMASVCSNMLKMYIENREVMRKMFGNPQEIEIVEIDR